MSYSITIVSPAERETIIRKATQSPMKFEDFHYLRNTLIPLPVIRIDIALPIYRMENFRTFTNQKEYITKEKLPQTFFSMGQESERAQQVQHEILSSLARKGKDGSVTPVLDVLRKDKQREFLLITSNGI